MKPLTLISIVILIHITKPGQAQTSTNPPVWPNNDKRIDAKLLTGFWIATDSLKDSVEFVDANYELRLNHYPPFHPYFFGKDSMNMVLCSGYFPNWPPYDCYINQVSTDTLELIYSQMGNINYRRLYVKLRE